jgi:predicted RNA-binding protein with TRAM domain
MYGRRSFAPVNVGDELEVKIEAVGEKGDGIAKKDGFVLFVPNTNTGDEVRIRVTKVLRKLGFAEVVGEAKATAKKPKKEKAEEPVEQSEAEDSEDFGEETQQ